MEIIGNIIKGAITLKEALTPDVNPIEAQEKVLDHLLSAAKDTLFGKQYNFEAISNAEDSKVAFASSVPYFDYNQINDKWWSKLHEGVADVTWPGNPSYFALSSGTTGKTSKRIPVTDAMLSAIKQAGIDQVTALSNFDLPAEFFSK